MRVLVAEDDFQVRHSLGGRLRLSGHACRLVETGECVLQSLNEEAFDVILLDRGLPNMDGIEILNRLDGHLHPPVLILSALNSPEDRVDGLRAGADDYLGKPFDYTELLIRLENLAKRSGEQLANDNILRVDSLKLNTVTREVHRKDVPINLTEKEFRLLLELMRRKGQVVTRSMLLEKIWGYRFDPQTNLIDVHISKLRTKIDKGQDVQLLKTIRAVGYVLG
ncbi:response regulator transcription factor [Terasakiella pusilla]|uniref:response regulator transcription factor n=1 Tax=Terasakiella pusilla TaxID=64973 RepID=UPI003AA7CAA8